MTSLAVEFCAFTVAIALTLHNKTEYAGKQWTHLELAHEAKQAKDSRFPSNPNFHVDPLALHQGLSLFKDGLILLGHELIAINTKFLYNMKGFMDLPPKATGWDIIINSHGEDNSIRTETETTRSVTLLVDSLLKSCEKSERKHAEFGQLCATLWQQNISIEYTGDPTRKRRKGALEIQDRQLNSYGRQICDYINENVCDEDEYPGVFIESAVKHSHSCAASASTEASAASGGSGASGFSGGNGFSGEIGEGFVDLESAVGAVSDDLFERIRDHDSVKECLASFPKKYVLFTSDQKALVLSLFDTILPLVEGKMEGERKFHAALITHNLVKNLEAFFELDVRRIERWDNNRDKVMETWGRKVNQGFEAAVWDDLTVSKTEKSVPDTEKTVSETDIDGQNKGDEKGDERAVPLYSYAAIIASAKRVQEDDRWRDNERIMVLTFFANWVKRFKDRAGKQIPIEGPGSRV